MYQYFLLWGNFFLGGGGEVLSKWAVHFEETFYNLAGYKLNYIMYCTYMCKSTVQAKCLQ